MIRKSLPKLAESSSTAVRTVVFIALITFHNGVGSAMAQSAVPPWLYPMNPPATASASRPDSRVELHLPNTSVTFTAAQLSDLFAAPDWYPKSHSPMPAIVQYGRRPDVYACGFCHSPAGQGRPENASLAGLPAAYIKQQIGEFKSGARRGAWPGEYRPVDRMIQAVMNMDDEDAAAAAEYFSRQHLQARAIIRESATIPAVEVSGWVYASKLGSEIEPLGVRVIEIAPDVSRHAKLDDRMQYIAYVPLGSTKRGRDIARQRTKGISTACVSCHGAKLRGHDLVPPIAGRSPTYIVRQLLAFQSLRRNGAASTPMLSVVDGMPLPDMIAVAAYAASLKP